MHGIQFCYPINHVDKCFSALSNALFSPHVIIPGVPTAGDNFNIICRLDRVVERLAVTPTVLTSFVNPPGGTAGDQSQDGSTYNLPRIFSPGMTYDVGTYTCFVTIIVVPNSYVTSGTAQLSMYSKPQYVLLKYIVDQFL